MKSPSCRPLDRTNSPESPNTYMRPKATIKDQKHLKLKKKKLIKIKDFLPNFTGVLQEIHAALVVGPKSVSPDDYLLSF